MDLRRENELYSLARLRDSIGGRELEGKDDILEDLRKMGRKWKRIKARLLDSEKERIGEEAVKVWLVELRDLAWEIEDLVGLYEYHVLAMQADEEEDEDEEDLAMQADEEEDEEEEDAEVMSPCEEVMVSSCLLKEDLDFGIWEPERWCSNILFDRAKANGKRTEVSFGCVIQKQNEVCLPQALTSSPNLRFFVKKIFREKSPRKVFIGRDKVTCCFFKYGRHIHIQKSLYIGDHIASSSSSETKQIKVPLAKSLPSPPPSLLKEISDSARKINERFDQIAHRKEASNTHYDNDDSEPLPSHIDDSSILCWEPLTSESLPDEIFIGRDEQMEEIVDMLIHIDVNPAAPEVIALVGMGGIGKTTLCQHIYNDSQVRKHFDLMGWVHVGESFHVIRVANSILNSFTEKSDKYDQLSIIQEELMEQLQGKRFLLVMDDVWCENNLLEWEPVLAPLLNNIPVEGGSSKILVTTRNQRVAEAARALKSIPLCILSEEDGWYLFSHYANVGINDSWEQLVDIGKGIVAKCEGLPLAIKVMGGLMRNKGDDVDSWRQILGSDFSNLKEEGGGGGVKEILGPLYLSYLHLTSHLKACFKFFNFLDKDDRRYDSWSVETLIDLWLAHNLVGEHKGKTWYRKQGRKIIDDFASRSFLEIDSTKTQVIMIRVHDLIFDLAQFVSGSEFCIEHSLSLEDIQSWTLPIGARHLKIETEDDLPRRNFFHISAIALRTVELINNSEHNGYVPDCILLANLRFISLKWLGIDFHFKHLRVLCIKGADIRLIPKSLYTLYNLIKLQFEDGDNIKRVSNLVGNLKNLRCLSFLHCSSLKSIPVSVSKLTSLEELKLENCYRVNELPTGITRLVNLHSLDTSATHITCMPLGLSNLRKLNHPSSYELRNGKLRHLLDDLNSLNLKGEWLRVHVGHYLEGKEYEEAELGINGQFHRMRIVFSRSNLDGIILNDDDNDDDDVVLNHEQILGHLRPHRDIRELRISNYSDAKLPIWMGDQSFNRLISLQLRYLLFCKTLSPIQKLPSLCELKIGQLHALENVVCEEDSEEITSGINLHPHHKLYCFPKLKKLTIFHCRSMEVLSIYQLTAIQTLSIEWCAKLQSIEFVDPSFLMKEHHDRGNSSSLVTELSLKRCHAMKVLSIYQSTSLKTLSIEDCEKLKSIAFVDPSSLMEEHHGRGNLPSLVTELTLDCCPAMDHLPIYQLPDLQKLSLNLCDNLKSIEFMDPSSSREEYQEKGNPSSLITDLSLYGCDAIELLPIYQLNALNKLYVHCCRKLKSIEFVNPSPLMEEYPDRGKSPSRITKLSLNSCPQSNSASTESFKEVSISNCPQLCFSSNSEPPESLKKVSFYNCEKLRGWYQTDASSKWMDIIHLREY